MRLPGILCFLSALFAAPLAAWNSTGHRVVAAIAYDRLTPAARTKADDLIRRHPDYSKFVARAPRDPAARARAAFIEAATWPDDIRNDPRFYDETRRDPRPTRLLPGFPNMGRHPHWHYINLPFTQDGTRTRNAPTPNAVTEIDRLTAVLGRGGADPANAAYALPWILHMVGDLHNPVHAATRFTRDDPSGDRGGNGVSVEPGRTLHGFWDGLPGPDPANAAFVDRLARELSTPSKRPLDAPVFTWAQEGLEIARSRVYTFGAGSGSSSRPIQLSPAYQEAARNLAREELQAAGQRLAQLLNRQLR